MSFSRNEKAFWASISVCVISLFVFIATFVYLLNYDTKMKELVQILKVIIIPVTSVMFSVSWALVLSRLLGLDLFDQVKTALEKQETEFTSTIEEIENFLSNWDGEAHLYHITQYQHEEKEEVSVWRYTKLKFNTFLPSNKMVCEVCWESLNKTKKIEKYKTEIGIRDSRIVLVMRALKGTDDKMPPILMFDNSGGTGEAYSGIVFHNTRALKNSINAAILSKTTLFDNEKNGTVVAYQHKPEETFENYSRKWRHHDNLNLHSRITHLEGVKVNKGNQTKRGAT